MFTTSNVTANPLHQSIKKVAYTKLFLKNQHDLLAIKPSACSCFKLRGCNLSKGCLILETLTALNTKSAVFLDVILSSLADKKILSPSSQYKMIVEGSSKIPVVTIIYNNI